MLHTFHLYWRGLETWITLSNIESKLQVSFCYFQLDLKDLFVIICYFWEAGLNSLNQLMLWFGLVYIEYDICLPCIYIVPFPVSLRG